jgi:hypothetical protein
LLSDKIELTLLIMAQSNATVSQLTFEMNLTIQTLRQQLKDAMEDIEALKTQVADIEQGRADIEDRFYIFVNKHKASIKAPLRRFLLSQDSDEEDDELDSIDNHYTYSQDDSEFTCDYTDYDGDYTNDSISSQSERSN